MDQPPFDESAAWPLEVPEMESYVGSIYYRESGHLTEFCWEVCGGSPYATIYPADLEAPVPFYVLRRVADGFRSKVLTCESRADFPITEPNMIHIHVAPTQAKAA